MKGKDGDCVTSYMKMTCEWEEDLRVIIGCFVEEAK